MLGSPIFGNSHVLKLGGDLPSMANPVAVRSLVTGFRVV